jgi:UDP-N-acetylmuramoyl-tripeptide--D-alanyl-D-alanine ligase
MSGTVTPNATTPMDLTLGQAQAWVPGARLLGEPAIRLDRVHTDSRSLQAGDLFVALRGERFDAHDFLPQTRTTGAAAVLAERDVQASGLPGLQVQDTRQALGALARGWRSQFQIPLVAVTGSNGKTTVTQMIASILRAWAGEASLATQGNFNNDIGLPLTLLRLRASHRCAVVEMGMNHPGEIAVLADWARPTVALVNNAQREHQEFMATVEAVAQENGAVLQALPADGVAVFPAADAYTPLWRALAGSRRCVTFGEVAAADVHLLDARWMGEAWQVRANTPAGELSCRVPVAGRHNVMNALAACASALAAGAPLQAVAQGLSSFAPVQGRSRAVTLRVAGHAATLIDDTYNANPDSVRAAIDVLADLPGPRLLVLGDMGEVGTQGPAFHAEVGAYAQSRGIETLLALGEQTRETVRQHRGARHFDAMENLRDQVLATWPACASVLVKGSRFMKMERVVQALEQAAAAEQGQEAPSCC